MRVLRKEVCKRPLMFSLLMILFIIIVYANLSYQRIRSSDDIYTKNIYITGTLSERSVKNDQFILYIKNAKIFSQSTENITDEYKTFLKGFGRKNGIICYLKEDVHCNIGESLTIACDVSSFDASNNPGEFDMRKYYISQGYGLRAVNATVVKRDNKRSLREYLVKIREYSSQVLHRYLSTEDASIMSVMMFADKSTLDEETKGIFKTGGILHILSISGLHISLMGELIVSLLKIIPLSENAEKKYRRYLYLIPMLIMVIYGVMIGFKSSAVRAIIMFIVMNIGKIIGKTYDTLTSLSISAFITLMLFPGMSLDTGFQLSYVAIIGIATVGQAFLDYHDSNPGWFQKLLSSNSISFVTMPIVMNSYYSIPVYAPVANFIILPGMSVLLLTGIILLIMGNISVVAARAVAWLCSAQLFCIKGICKIISTLPFATYICGHRTYFRIIIFYIVMIGAALIVIYYKRKIWLENKRVKNYIARRNNRGSTCKDEIKEQERLMANRYRRKLVKTNLHLNISYTVLFTALIVYLILPGKRGNIIEYLDVGQGDGIVILNEDKTVVIDGGSSSRSNVGKYTIQKYLEYMGRSKVDIWFLTHPDSDHVSGFSEIYENGDIAIESIAYPEILNDEFSDILLKGSDNTVKRVMLNAGDKIPVNSDCFYVVSPDKRLKYADENEASLVMVYEVEGLDYNFIFMADSTVKAEKQVERLIKNSKKGNILKCAHHGSAIDTNTEEYIRQIKPIAAIISCGRDNPYNHPHTETIEYLEKSNSYILRTDEMGGIEIDIKKGYSNKSRITVRSAGSKSEYGQ